MGWGTGRVVVAALCGVALVAASGCGEADFEAGSSAPDDWQVEVVGVPPPDSAPLVLEHDDVRVVVTTNDEGDRLEGSTSTAGGPMEDATFEGGPPDAIATAGVATTDGLLLFGATWEPGAAVAWTSADGVTWEAEELSGFEGQAEVAEVVATPGGYVAVGMGRTTDDVLESWQPLAWRSEDARSWQVVRLDPGAGIEQGNTPHVADVAAVGDAVVAVGATGAEATVWRSEDGGATWSARTAPAHLDAVEAEGDVLVATGSGADGGALLGSRSEDAGATWTPIDIDGAGGGSTHGGMVGVDGDGSFWLAGNGAGDEFTDPDRCYADPGACGDRPAPVLLASTDGESWRSVDLSDAGGDGPLRADEVRSSPDAGTTVLGSDERGLVLASSTARLESLPEAPAPEGVDAVPAEPLVEHGADLEVGTTYRYPLYTHCGIDELGTFDGQRWTLVEGEVASDDIEAGRAPEDWAIGPDASIYGYLVLVDEDTIEYSLEAGGEPIATYEPSPGEAPGCL